MLTDDVWHNCYANGLLCEVLGMVLESMLPLLKSRIMHYI